MRILNKENGCGLQHPPQYRAGGEFKQIGSVSMLAPDTLQVYDRELARITFYSKQDDRWALVNYLDRPAGSREYGADMFFTLNSLYPQPCRDETDFSGNGKYMLYTLFMHIGLPDRCWS